MLIRHRAFWSDPRVFENSNNKATLTSNYQSGYSFPEQALATVTYTAVDNSGNINTCSFTVFIVDVEAPVLVCPRNVLVPNDPGQNFATVQWSVPRPTDNSGLSVNLTATANPGNIFNMVCSAYCHCLLSPP